MSKYPSHIIEKLMIDVQTKSKKLAYTIKDEKDVFFMEELMALLESIFDAHLPESEQLVQLGNIKIELTASSGDFEFDVKRQVLEQLEAVLPEFVFEHTSKKLAQNIPNSSSKTTALLHFLRTGNFPWWFNVPIDNAAMDALIYECIDASTFIDGFIKGLKQQSFRTRTIAQLSNGFLAVIFNKILIQRFGKATALPATIELDIKLDVNKPLRAAFWSLIIQICNDQKSEQTALLWKQFVKAIPATQAISKSTIKQLDNLAIAVFSEPQVDKGEVVLLANRLKNKDKTHKDLLKTSSSKKLKKQHALEKNLATEKETLAAKIKSDLDSTITAQSPTADTIKTAKDGKVLKNKTSKDKSAKETRFDSDEQVISKKLSSKNNIKISDVTAAKGKRKASDIEDEENLKEKNHAKIHKKSNQKDSQAIQTSDQSVDAQQNTAQNHESVNDLNEKGSKLENNKTAAIDPDLNKLELTKQCAKRESMEQSFEQKSVPQESHFYASHCGLVLLHPFLTSFLKNCELLDANKQLKDSTLAAHLLHYVATGKTAAYEYQLRFERFICDIPSGLPMDRHIEISKTLIAKADELLQAILGHLPQLKSSAPELLQNEFLSREGKVLFEGENPRIIIERKTQDMLLDSKPWSTSIVKLPWLPNLLYVDW